jgi:hypothetical protein
MYSESTPTVEEAGTGMPHIDIKYRAGVVQASDLVPLMQQVAEIVGAAFDEDPAYVSVEIVPQNEFSLNRKDIDLELDASPDEAGMRKRNLTAVAGSLRDLLVKHAQDAGLHIEVSAFCRIFAAGTYEYGAVE